MNWFKTKKPKDPQKEFGDRLLTVYPTWADARARTNPKRLKVVHICGNLAHPSAFQVNGDFLVSMLDAYSEINKAAKPDKETHEAFCDITLEKIERSPTTEADEIREFDAEDISGE